MTDDKPHQRYDRFILRFPNGMRERLAICAKANGRSMNSEVVAILADALDMPASRALSHLEDLVVRREAELERVQIAEIAASEQKSVLVAELASARARLAAARLGSCAKQTKE